MRQLLSILFIVLTITALSLAYRRDDTIQTNNFEEDFNLRSGQDVGAASLDVSGPISITFPDPNNCTCSVGQFTFQCLPGNFSQFDLDIPIDLTVEVQQRLKIRDVYIWIGPQGTQPSTDYTNWGNPSIPSGGVSYAFHNLHGFFYQTRITLRDIISILTNTDGSYRTCFRIEVVVKVDRYCGFSNRPRAFRHSPEGCDFNYQAIYPSTDSYFHVALNNDGSVNVNNDTLYFKGYCLDPTRSVYPNQNYQGQIYSSYDVDVLNSEKDEFVEAPENFPYVNYIANHESEYLSRFLSGHQCTWQDVQNAIWRILFPNATATIPALRNILKNSSEDCVEWIVDDALANGKDYLPTCPGGKYLMVIFPMKNNTCNCSKDYQTQLVAFPTGGSCLNRCAPKVCHDVLRAGRKVCLTGECAPLPSPSVSVTSKPTLPSPDASTTSTQSTSYSSTPSTSYSSTPSTSYSSTPSTSYSSTPSTSYSSTPSTSYSSTQSTSYSNTQSTSYSNTQSTSYSSTQSTSYSSTASTSYSSTASISRTSAPSGTGTPCPSRTSRPSRSVSSTPCPSRSNSKSTSSAPSLTSKPNVPSVTSTPRPSRSATSTPECHQASASSRPSRSSSSTPECHHPSASPSRSAPCHNMTPSASKSAPCHQPSPSPSPCDKPGKGNGRGHGHDNNEN